MNDQTEDIVDRMAEDLRRGLYPAGAWLKQVDLQARYGVSRSVVRKALETLAVRRLVRHELNRGYSVHPTDGEESARIDSIRSVLEPGFTPEMVAHATEEEIAQLHALAERFFDDLQALRFSALYETNLAFHRTLLGTTRNPQLVSLVDELRLRTAPAPVSQWVDAERIKISAKEHLAMVAALQARDAQTLADLLRKHIQQRKS